MMQGYLNGDNIGTVTWSLHNIDIIPNMSCISILREIFVKKKKSNIRSGKFSNELWIEWDENEAFTGKYLDQNSG